MALTKVTGKGIGAIDEITTDTAGTSNFIGGVNAGNSIASGGNYNVALGDEAGTAITTGDGNVAVGFEALKTEDAHGKNIAIGYQALKVLDVGADGFNTVIGYQAGVSMNTGTVNTLIGHQAGDALTTGNNNVAIGHEALGAEIQGDQNVAVGVGALQAQNNSSDTNSLNTAVGYNAGLSITTGDKNTIVGSLAGDGMTTGFNNTVMGYEAMSSATVSGAHVAIGYEALKNYVSTNNSSEFNTCVGTQAGKGCTTGEKNTFIGGKAGGDNTQTGDKNTCVGWEAGFNLTTGGNNICIGHQSGRSTSPSGTMAGSVNKICLGDDNITHIFCADTSISSSDSRDKADITDFNIGLNWIKDLRPVTYKWDKRSWYGTEEKPLGTPDGSKKSSKVHIGFLAQEVLEVEKANGFGDNADTMLTCNITEDEQRYGMKYERLVPILVNAVQELSAKNDALEARIKKLEDG